MHQTATKPPQNRNAVPGSGTADGAAARMLSMPSCATIGSPSRLPVPTSFRILNSPTLESNEVSVMPVPTCVRSAASSKKVAWCHAPSAESRNGVDEMKPGGFRAVVVLMPIRIDRDVLPRSFRSIVTILIPAARKSPDHCAVLKTVSRPLAPDPSEAMERKPSPAPAGPPVEITVGTVVADAPTTQPAVDEVENVSTWPGMGLAQRAVENRNTMKGRRSDFTPGLET